MKDMMEQCIISTYIFMEQSPS